MTTKTVPQHDTSNGIGETFQLVDIPPAIAAEYLVHNTHNRNPKHNAIERFASDMRAGEWQFTGEPIRFAGDGTLIDGQNRLHAVIQSGTTQRMLVIRGLPMEAQRDIDTGTPRSLADVLMRAGEPNWSHLATLVRQVASWRAGYRRAVFSVALSHSAYLRTLDECPDIRELVQPARNVAANCDIPPSVVGLAWWVFQQIDYDDAGFFFARLGDGQGLFKGGPIYELRRTIHDGKSVRSQPNRTWMLAITIKAWNAYRNGETVGLYRWRPGGAKPENFPEPV